MDATSSRGTVQESLNHYGNHIAANGRLEVIDCIKCGYAHLFPLPTQTDVDTYYQQDEFYRTHGPPDWFAKERREHQAGLWRPAYDFQMQLLGNKPRVVDYGCGTGWFIQHYRAQHGLASGVEPAPSARAASPVEQYIYSSMNMLYISGVVPGRSTESARAVLVLEHVLDPITEVLALKKTALGPRGRLLIVVPNERNPLQKLVQRREGTAWWVQKPHINYFDRHSIRRLLQACELKVVYQGGTFPMELLYLVGFKYIGNDAIGRKAHNWRLAFEHRLGPRAFSLYHMLYNVLGWGRETLIVGQRHAI